MAFIAGFGAYLPSRIAANAEIAARLGCDPGWIVSASGIEERRIAGDDESLVTMGAEAARDCLSRCSMTARDISLAIVATGSSGRRFPAPGAEIAHGLGLGGIPVIDLPMASAGSLYAMALAADLAAAYGPVLVVATEKMSPIVLGSEIHRDTAILFGDGAGAVVIRPDSGVAVIGASCLHSDGAFAGELRLGLTGLLEMNGQAVILQSTRKIPSSIAEVLQKVGLRAEDVDRFILHQANRNLIVRVARTLGVSADRFYCNINRLGNTSSASMLIAAAEWSATGGFSPGKPVVFSAFGAGFHWGALVATGVPL
jgi:3-oxoacyl-[acyl-carrier-protein] synthase III